MYNLRNETTRILKNFKCLNCHHILTIAIAAALNPM